MSRNSHELSVGEQRRLLEPEDSNGAVSSLSVHFRLNLTSASYLEEPYNPRSTSRTWVISGQEAESEDALKNVEDRLLRKLDLRMSLLFFIYILNFVDRNSAAAARLRGFEEDLGLDKTQFAGILSTFYIGYMLMQIPSNMLLAHVGKPSLYLPGCTLLWGAISFSTGLVTNYQEAAMARFLLGFVEAGFYPGALFLISKWYRRNELSQRMALFSCGIFFGEAFGSLIASGILDIMDGVLGYAAWRWLFFVEGGLTILVATLALFILPDFPESKTVAWLTAEEHAVARRRMFEDSDKTTIAQSSKGILHDSFLAFSDWKVWCMGAALYFAILSVSFAMYFPTLASTLGYNARTTLLLCIPPWLFAAAESLWVSRHSDKTGERCMHVVIPFTFGILGFLLGISTMNPIVRYASLFLLAQTKAGTIGLFAWASAATSGSPGKRAVALALVNSLCQSSNIVGAYVWVKAWGPTYHRSFAICATTLLISIVICLLMRRNFKRLNQRMDLEDERRREGDGSEGYTRSWRYHI